MEREKIIKKLNIINKLLRQDFVALKKGGKVDPEALAEINSEIKVFLMAQMDALLGAKGTIDSGITNQQGFIEFTPQEAAVLKEFASKLLSRAPVPGTIVVETTPLHIPNADSPYLDFNPPPLPKTKVSPVLDALQQAGFNPNADPKERAAKIKDLEKSKK